MIEYVENGILDFLILGQDDAHQYGLHRPEKEALEAEIAALSQDAQNKIVLYNGTDVLAQLLLTKLIIEEFNVSFDVCVEYSRQDGSTWIAPYQDKYYEDIIYDYVDLLGGNIVTNAADADIVLMANTGGTGGNFKGFCDNIELYLDKGYNVALSDDALPGTTDYRMFYEFSSQLKLANLIAYSGWNVGQTMAQAFSRLALTSSVQLNNLELLRQATESHVELTLQEWVHLHEYRNNVRSGTYDYAEQLGEDPQKINDQNNFELIDSYAVNNTVPKGKQKTNPAFR